MSTLMNLPPRLLDGVRLPGRDLVVETSKRTVRTLLGRRLSIAALITELVESDEADVREGANVSLLAHALMIMALRKTHAHKNVDRLLVGTPAVQIRETESCPFVLFLYEAGYRQSLFPRFRWDLAFAGEGYAVACLRAIALEMQSEEAIAKQDGREPATIPKRTAEQVRIFPLINDQMVTDVGRYVVTARTSEDVGTLGRYIPVWILTTTFHPKVGTPTQVQMPLADWMRPVRGKTWVSDIQ